MNLEKYTHASQNLITQAAELATQMQHATLLPLHLLAIGINQEFCRSIFTTLQVPLDQLQQLTDQELNKLPKFKSAQLSLDGTTQTFFNECKRHADQMGDTYISLDQFILEWSITNALPDSIKNFFKQIGFTKTAVSELIKQLRKGNPVTSQNAENQYQILEKYCVNVTKQAQEGHLDPVIGRHEEIRRVMQILSRRTKNNPVLIGEPGVGKTAIVEGIAQRIINNDVPESLKNKKMYSLDLGLLIAGAKYQGEFEERLKGVLKAIEDGGDDIILFIDEMHMLVGAGSAGGAMDASNLLKPALARGTLHCIGATTLKEYKKYIEKDAALERRFQQVLVEEPTVDDAISILRGLKERFEIHHGIRIKDQALIDAVLLSAKNIPDRFLPDKAIDLVDEAASMVKMSIDSHPESIDKLDRHVRQLEIEKVALSKEKDDPVAQQRLQDLEKDLANLKEDQHKLLSQWKSEKAPLERINKLKEDIENSNYQFQLAEREGNYAKASEIKYGKIAKLEAELALEQEKIKELNPQLIKQQVDENDIANVLSRWTKIPAEKLQTSDSQKLLNMEEVLKQKVVGQDEAVAKVSHAIQMHRAGLTDPNKPIGSFLFLGPTGVGKTEVAKTLADFLFDDPKKLVRIDMSEYMEKHAVARLIGAPPGYVGYEEGGQLTEKVRRQPYSVLLFDEIEKAHPDVFNIFLQILDEGHLTDGQGRTVSFKNTIIIMTSNVGSDLILKSKELTDKIKQEIEQRLQSHFKPEFLNRIDAIVFFNKLPKEVIFNIVRIQLNDLIARLHTKNIALTVSNDAIQHVAELGYSDEFGARPLKRAIQNYIMLPVSQYILKNPQAKEVDVDLKKDEIVIK